MTGRGVWYAGALPTPAEIAKQARREVSDALDTLRSDWISEPTDAQAEAINEARRLLAKAEGLLDRASWP